MNTALERSTRFRELIARQEGLSVMGVRDAYDAKVLEAEGAEGIYAGGFAAAASFGELDQGLYHDHMIRHGRRIASKVGIPVMLDMDDGGVSVRNIERNLTDVLETAPIGGFHVEDQEGHRCGHHGGKKVHEFKMAVARMKCVADVRDKVRPDCFFLARTDAFVAAGHAHDEKAGGDIDECIRRVKAYIDVGADGAWCEFNGTRLFHAYEKLAEAVQKHKPGFPLAFNITPSKEWYPDSVSFERLNQLGYKFLFCTYGALQAQAVATAMFYRDFKINGHHSLAGLQGRMKMFPRIQSVNTLLGIKEATAFEEAYDPTAEERFRTSEGHR